MCSASATCCSRALWPGWRLNQWAANQLKSEGQRPTLYREPMRPVLRAYVWLLVTATGVLVTLELGSRSNGNSNFNLVLVIALLLLCVAGERLTFQVNSGWATHAGTVPHLATAF